MKWSSFFFLFKFKWCWTSYRSINCGKLCLPLSFKWIFLRWKKCSYISIKQHFPSFHFSCQTCRSCSSLRQSCRCWRLRPQSTILFRLWHPRWFNRWLKEPTRNTIGRCCQWIILSCRPRRSKKNCRLYCRSTQRIQRCRTPWTIG